MDEIKNEADAAAVMFLYLTQENPALLETKQGKEMLYECSETLKKYPETVRTITEKNDRLIVKNQDGRVFDFGEM